VRHVHPIGLARPGRIVLERHAIRPGSRSMRLSARNILRGTVVSVARGATTAHVRIDIGQGTIVTAAITNEAVEELGLAPGLVASAVIKASDVIVAVE
jgi:molybdopterin-binding protein